MDFLADKRRQENIKAYLQFLIDMIDMRFEGAGGDKEGIADLLVAFVLEDKVEHFPFFAGEGFEFGLEVE